jgi:uncharacterized membrane protein YraQ (UPF0718 family)
MDIRLARKKQMQWRRLFPALVLAIYALLIVASPEKGFQALGNSGKILLHLTFPIGLVFTLMLAINLFLKPSHIIRFMAKGSGIKGISLSAAAGIVAMGPIYVWYPLLKELRQKGASSFLITIFLSNRAVKPFFLPIMISYFGWVYTALLTLFTILGSLAAGYLVGAVVRQ